MTSLTTQDGKLVVRDGKLGTGQACCCGGGGGGGNAGRCCFCSISFDSDIFLGSLTCFPKEVIQAHLDAGEAAATVLMGLLQDNGWVCTSYSGGGVTPEEYQCVDENGNYFTSYRTPGASIVQAGCCGSVDYTSQPIVYDKGPGAFGQGEFYPCVGPYIKGNCVGPELIFNDEIIQVTKEICDQFCQGRFELGVSCNASPSCSELEYEQENPLP